MCFKMRTSWKSTWEVCPYRECPLVLWKEDIDFASRDWHFCLPLTMPPRCTDASCDGAALRRSCAACTRSRRGWSPWPSSPPSISPATTTSPSLNLTSSPGSFRWVAHALEVQFGIKYSFHAQGKWQWNWLSMLKRSSSNVRERKHRIWGFKSNDTWGDFRC